MSEVKVAWVVELEVFPSDWMRTFATAIASQGHRILCWEDEWRGPAGGPIPTMPFVFLGSLGNAAWVRENMPWMPGAYCDVEAFRCTNYYPRAERWLLCGSRWRALPAQQFINEAIDQHLMHFFVRPDSPLKPFSGRLLTRDEVSWEAIDYGFYYDNRDLVVVVSEPRSITAEWRYVVVDRRVVAGSAYAAQGRAALPDSPEGAPWRFAQEVASALDPPEEVYVLDVCEADDRLHLLELNPFSGADLYACDPGAVVRAVSAVASRNL